VGIDIGTTAVKAVVADAEGNVLARARVPHRLMSPAPDQLEHDAARAWRRGPVRALAEVGGTAEGVAGVCVTSMVPSLTVVDARGIPRAPGLLYGDARGHEAPPAGGAARSATDAAMPDAVGFVRWAVRQAPGARGYWPAQAVANYAIGGVPALDTGAGLCMGSLRKGAGWDPDMLASVGVRESQLPVVVNMGEVAGKVKGSGAALCGGTVDALCDQIVSGADEAGDVLVICGATLIVWAVVDEWFEAPGLWTLPHTTPGKVLIGGPSNAGALFVDWARALVRGRGHTASTRRAPGPGASGKSGMGDAGEPARPGDPERVPVWTPYIRGERSPYHDRSLRAGLHGLDITHDAEAVERAAYEASGFVVRHLVEIAGLTPRRIVASGGGTKVVPWMQAIADASGLPVDTVGVSEGAALGAAYMARWTAGLESSLDGARRWARLGYHVEPDPRWQAAASARYRTFLAHSPPD